MYRILKLMAMVVALAIVGCEDDQTNSNQNVGNNVYNAFGTIQGTVFNATTGARINDSSLRVTLVQGASYRSPNILFNRSTDTTFAGDFAFLGVPVTLGQNLVYRIVVTADGYQQFERYFTPDVAASSNNTIDQNVNFVGNIYLFPLGADASDVTVNVRFNGEAVSGATVLMQPLTTNNSETTPVTNTDVGAFSSPELNVEPDVFRLPAVTGLLASLSATTDANGVATFPAASLVLGGQYRVMVLPVTHNGVALSLATGNTITIGTSVRVQNVAMGEVEPGNDNGLYIVSHSNIDANNIQSNGVLTITFNRPVKIHIESGIGAVLFGTPVRTAALAADPVTATLSADRMVVTLTPNFATAPVAFDGTNGVGSGTPTADINLQITYSNLLVTIDDGLNGDTVYNAFTDLTSQTGTGISGIVQITGPEDY